VVRNQTECDRVCLFWVDNATVLAPTLFNIYINDLPETTSRKFIYADDICCATQAKTFKELEHTLTSDMSDLSDYSAKWRLTPSVLKRSLECFIFTMLLRQQNSMLC